MSMHKIPLTDLEHEGLVKHHLPVGKPSQLSDCFRAGVQWVIRSIQECENGNNRLYMEGRPQEEKLKLKLALSEASVRSLENLIPRLKEIPMQLIKENMALQAKIDALMMEYCPSEMTAEQIKNWENHQVVCVQVPPFTEYIKSK